MMMEKSAMRAHYVKKYVWRSNSQLVCAIGKVANVCVLAFACGSRRIRALTTVCRQVKWNFAVYISEKKVTQSDRGNAESN